MERHRNLGGRSNVHSYEIGDDYITVLFNDEVEYTYTLETAGGYGLERMKSLAMAGQGLNSYINTDMRKRYESKSSR